MACRTTSATAASGGSSHKDFKPGPQPHMLDETPAQLVAHLEHPNGWWRDTAQRMLIVKGDKSVVPALVKMAETIKNHLARLHAMWTLEGLDALTPELVRAEAARRTSAWSAPAPSARRRRF